MSSNVNESPRAYVVFHATRRGERSPSELDWRVDGVYGPYLQAYNHAVTRFGEDEKTIWCIFGYDQQVGWWFSEACPAMDTIAGHRSLDGVPRWLDQRIYFDLMRSIIDMCLFACPPATVRASRPRSVHVEPPLRRSAVQPQAPEQEDSHDLTNE